MLAYYLIDEHLIYLIFSSSASIFSMNIPYPLVGSFTNTWVTAPTILPFWIIGLPDMSVVNERQQNSLKNQVSLLLEHQKQTISFLKLHIYVPP